MLEKLKEIIEELKNTKNDTHLRVSDGIIFEQGIKIFLSNLIQDYKKENIKEIKEKKLIDKKPTEEPATEKQRELLKKLGIGFDKGITKKEAWQVIFEEY